MKTHGSLFYEGLLQTSRTCTRRHEMTSTQSSHLPETPKTSRAHGLWLRFKGGEEREVQWKQGSECLAADACKSVLIWSCGFKEESRIFSLPASQNKIIRLQEAERNCTVIQTRPGSVQKHQHRPNTNQST